mmetsp:Transcript_31260/g.66155  ORF Transcript_31260/g.66155 Transcript_31260/m.66155 type:complete len:114 (+) Transcript_31260:543-884(+)
MVLLDRVARFRIFSHYLLALVRDRTTMWCGCRVVKLKAATEKRRRERNNLNGLPNPIARLKAQWALKYVTTIISGFMCCGIIGSYWETIIEYSFYLRAAPEKKCNECIVASHK